MGLWVFTDVFLKVAVCFNTIKCWRWGTLGYQTSEEVEQEEPSLNQCFLSDSWDPIQKMSCREGYDLIL